MNLALLNYFKLGSKIILKSAAPFYLNWQKMMNIPFYQIAIFKQPTINDSLLTISTFRRKPAKLKKAKRKQRRKKIRRMNKANKERRNY